MFAILFEVLFIEIKRKSITLLVGKGGGGLRGTKIVKKHFVNKLAQETMTFPKNYIARIRLFVLSFGKLHDKKVLK